MKTHWVMDYETLSNCFIGVFEEVKTQKKVNHNSSTCVTTQSTWIANNGNKPRHQPRPRLPSEPNLD